MYASWSYVYDTALKRPVRLHSCAKAKYSNGAHAHLARAHAHPRTLA
jgi:hypothetical protein